MSEGPAVPIIDVTPLVTGEGDEHSVSTAMADACQREGFFYVVGHGVSEDLQHWRDPLNRHQRRS